VDVIRTWQPGLLGVVATAAGVLLGYPAWVVFAVVWFTVLMAVGVSRRAASGLLRAGSDVENANLWYTFGASVLIAWRGSQTGTLGVVVALVVATFWFAAIQWLRGHATLGRRL